MSPDISGVIGRIFVPVAVTVVFAAGRHFLPPRKTNPVEDLEAAGRSSYVAMAMLLAGLTIAFGSYFLLKWANAVWAARDVPHVMTILPGTSTWIFFPLFGGPTLCWEGTWLLMRVFLGRAAADSYAAWSEGKTGFQSTRLLRLMGYFLAWPVAGFTLLAIPVHASLNDDGISIGRYARSAPERHRYADVAEFLLVDGVIFRNGNFDSRPAIILRFRDGREWNSWTLTESRALDPKLVVFLTKRIGREPIHEHVSD